MSKKYPEDALQATVAEFLDLQKVLWCHVANERKTSPQAGARLKKKGVKSGVPDVLIFEKNERYSGLAIELKVGKNTTTDNQKEWLKNLKKNGWQSKVCYSFDEVESAFGAYRRNSLE